MAKASSVQGEPPAAAAGPGTVDRLIAEASKRHGPPPVDLWNPPDCGDIDMRIASDGTWFYQGTPIGRPALVRLFASVLRRDGDRHVLVTPVEKVGIAVEDAPFLAVELARAEDGRLRLRTNLDDWVTLGPAHPLRFAPGPAGSLKPYALVRGALWALATRPLFYDLVAAGETRTVDGVAMFGIASGPTFFPMTEADGIEDLAAGAGLA